jgi:hypothetical protein
MHVHGAKASQSRHRKSKFPRDHLSEDGVGIILRVASGENRGRRCLAPCLASRDFGAAGGRHGLPARRFNYRFRTV